MALSDHHDLEELDDRSDRWSTVVCLLVWFVGAVTLWVGAYSLFITIISLARGL